jgi:proteic killer suppression protein
MPEDNYLGYFDLLFCKNYLFARCNFDNLSYKTNPIFIYSKLVYIQNMNVVTQVTLTKSAEKDVRKLPRNIQEALLTWITQVSTQGLANTRKIPGYHDEPLSGDRKGQRSVRLNRAYRAIYIQNKDGEIELVTIIEVNKHKY